MADLSIGEGGRTTVIELYEYLRSKIISGELAAGSELNQASLARGLSVSRMPMREAFRMLQQEGLIVLQPNQRASVASFDIGEQASIWAARVALETLAIDVSMEELTAHHFEALRQAVNAMAQAMEAEDQDAYRRAHREFHGVAGFRAGVEVNNLIRVLADKTTRFLALRGQAVPYSRGQSLQDHLRIMRAIESKSRQDTRRAVALHIGLPGIVHLAEVAPDFEPRILRQAISLVGGSEKEEG